MSQEVGLIHDLPPAAEIVERMVAEADTILRRFRRFSTEGPDVQYTAEQQAEFKREFSLRRRRQILVAFPSVVLILGFAILARTGQADGENLMGVPLLVHLTRTRRVAVLVSQLALPGMR